MTRNYFKFGWDILIALVFVLLYNTRVFGGLAFHEIAGLAIGLGFLVHIILNTQWLKSVTLKLFSRKTTSKTLLGYFLNILLLVATVFITVSGLMISKVLFPNFGAVNERWFRLLHVDISYLMLAIVGIHLGLHSQWIITMLKRVFKVGKVSWPILLIKVTLVLVVIFGGLQLLEAKIAPIIANSGPNISENLRRPPLSFEGSADYRNPTVNNRRVRPHGREYEEGFGEPGKLEFSPYRSSPLTVVPTFLGEIGIFAVITAYFDKLFARRTTMAKNIS